MEGESRKWGNRDYLRGREGEGGAAGDDFRAG